MGYDIIGDIHGQADKLIDLLAKMGYRERNKVWQHPTRQVIFVGDFIDRGLQQLATVNIVRAMVEAGSALAVLGNHELNAIAWHTPHPERRGEYLRPHPPNPLGEKNRHQHQAFLNEVEHLPDTHQAIIDWFLSLPLWLDLPDIRVIHACWHQTFIEFLQPYLHNQTIPKTLLVEATTEPENPKDKETPIPSVFKAVEAICKGLEIPLPKDHIFIDKDGIKRHRVRIRWWDSSAVTYRQTALLSEQERDCFPDLPIPDYARLTYPSNKPLFFGHYWLTGQPKILTKKLVCVDYSAGNGNPLVAYRWDGEIILNNSKFVYSI